MQSCSTDLVSRVSAGMLWNLAGKTAATALGFALMVLVARWLPPSEFGAYSLVMAGFTMLITTTSLGLETGLMKYIPEFKARNETALAGEVFRVALAVKFALLLVAAAALLLSAGFLSGTLSGGAQLQWKHLALILAALIPCGLNVLFRGALDSHFKQRLLNIVDVIAVTSRLALTACLLIRARAVSSVLAANAIVEAGLLVFFLVAARPRICPSSELISPSVKRFFTFSLTMWAMGFAAFLMGKSSDLLLLGIFTDARSAGFYNLAYTFSNQAYMFMTLPLGNLALVAASELYGRRDEGRLAAMSGLLLKYHLLFVLPICAGGVLLAEPILRCLYGENYAGATLLLQLYIATFAINILFSGPFSTLLTSIEEHRILMVSTLVLGVSNLLLNLFLIPHFGVLGALAGTGSIQVISVCWLGIILRRKIRWEFPGQFACKTFLAAAVMAAGLMTLRSRATNIGMLLAVVALGGVVYALVLKASRPFSEADLDVLHRSRMPGSRFFLRLLKPV